MGSFGNMLLLHLLKFLGSSCLDFLIVKVIIGCPNLFGLSFRVQIVSLNLCINSLGTL
jgi:hypothetical protein